MISPKRKELFGAVAADLKALSALPLLKTEDSEIWDDEADKFRSKLYSIRLKDSGYKERQENFIHTLILNLEAKTRK